MSMSKLLNPKVPKGLYMAYPSENASFKIHGLLFIQ